MTNTENRSDPLTLITTHTNADFDAVASMLAAQKLYPGSVVVFPGFHEKSMKNFFVSTMAYLFQMADYRQIQPEQVGRLVIVDTKQAGRIGELEELLNRTGIEIHVYDHHPQLENDIRADFEMHRSTGANVTMLVDLIREQTIGISPDEATVMCLGIYEDTGAFTYPSTTQDDFAAAAFLLGKGASLTTISDLIAKEMDSEQIALLNDMFRAATHYPINGKDVVITTVSRDEYIHDLAFLVQKMLRIENLSAVFAIALMKNKIYIAARSRTPDVDVGAIIREIGGGGHSFAAAASIKNKTLAQVENRIIDLLKTHVRSTQQAKDIMSTPAITAPHDISCEKARQLLSRYNINALLVMGPEDRKQRLAGFITRQVIEKALYHHLDEIPIKEYMTTEFAVVAPEADISEVQEKIIENKQRILPVVDNGHAIGAITRTDLLNTLIYHNQQEQQAGHSAEPPAESRQPKTKSVSGFLRERLNDDILDMLRRIGRVADAHGFSAYVVGGFVRDLFLYRHNEDIDIVIEGNGIEFARAFARKEGARVNAYDKFGTAVIIFADGFKIDVASARMEYYKFPAALPTVEMSSIKLDLFRRDFTINTLAIFLNPDKFGRLIDFFGGMRDMKEKAIRILHNLSFVEDPTRVFRAIRFEKRFDFSIGKLTAGLIHNAVKMDFFKRLSGRRVFSELRHILEEQNPIPALVRLEDFGLLKVIDPSIRMNKALRQMLDSARNVLSWYVLLYRPEECRQWIVYFLVLTRHADQEKAQAICRHFELAPRHEKIFIQERAEAETCLYRLSQGLPDKNSRLYEELNGLRMELILYMMAVTSRDDVRRAISFYVTDLKDIRISVKGKDLQKMGLSPSPLFGRILRTLLREKLDGRLQTRHDELELARRLIDGRETAG
ncbi:tRNA nucleotidyltransferase (CCA-adding enzyme) [Desulfosalsimonas propionicica]|uniref:tRNA nucleotidyltransferase (CCA-adding enzyme) n=1 Tax=Desulfosalsimonas propionicica TaxID=332175 RepID=A0A7W0CBS1_9BACT|nr:tRNA nucleotidyltransferase (CCA-adding enzyme) [Desulfosalsimonas propionicica]